MCHTRSKQGPERGNSAEISFQKRSRLGAQSRAVEEHLYLEVFSQEPDGGERKWVGGQGQEETKQVREFRQSPKEGTVAQSTGGSGDSVGQSSPGH